MKKNNASAKKVRELARAKFNVSSHVKNHTDEQFISAYKLIKELSSKKFTSVEEVADVLEKKHSLSSDTLEDVIRMLSNLQNEKFLKSINVSREYVHSFISRVKTNKFSKIKT